MYNTECQFEYERKKFFSLPIRSTWLGVMVVLFSSGVLTIEEKEKCPKNESELFNPILQLLISYDFRVLISLYEQTKGFLNL